MPTCKKTGLWKYGDMGRAKDEMVKSGKKYTHKVAKCDACQCLHVVPMDKPEQEKAIAKRNAKKETAGGASGWVHVNVAEIDNETEKAFYFILSDDEQPENLQSGWFPKSVIADADDYRRGDRDCVVSVQEWFGKETFS